MAPGREEPLSDEESEGKARKEQPTPADWLGDIVVVSYTGSPNWSEADSPFSIARAEPEIRTAAFFLQEVNQFGVVLRRAMDNDEVPFAAPVFMSWSAIHQITQVPDVEESAQNDE